MSMLRSLGWAALGTGFTFLMTTLGAAMVFFLSGEPRPRFQKAMLGFAAGVMTAASVWSLLLPAIDQASEEGGVPGWLPAAAGMLLGVVFLAALDALLYFYGGRRLFWELKWYWGACGALLAALFLVGRLILFAVLVYGITPFPQMLLASYLLVEKGLGLPGKAADTTALVLTVVLIAGHFLWLCRLERRAAAEAERTSA